MRRSTTLISLAATLSVLLILGTASAVLSAAPQNFVVQLSGEDEVPPRDTDAVGVAKFQLSADGSELSYILIASNIDNVVGAHIHLGAVGVNGPVVVGLFAGASGSGPQDGVLARGTITAADLTGPLAGLTLEDLIEAMEAGNTYVNVHTNDGVGDPNSGPGDFPGGEIRGQI